MEGEPVVHKVSRKGFRRRAYRKLKSSQEPTGVCQRRRDAARAICGQSNSPACSTADGNASLPLEQWPPPEDLDRLRAWRATFKDRRSSSADSATLERAARTLQSIRALKGVVGTETRAPHPLAVPAPAATNTQHPSTERRGSYPDVEGDTWSCVLADQATRRRLVQSLTNEGHVTGNCSIPEESDLEGMNSSSSIAETLTYYKAHEFQVYSCKHPQRCSVCHRLMWSFSQQAMRCKVCGVVIHSQCYPTAMEGKCVPSKKMIQQAFGVDLTTIALIDNSPIPKVVRECVQVIESRGLAEKSLYNVSGSMSEVMKIKEEYNKGEEVDFSLITDIKIVTGVLKQFLRELPEPLITSDTYSQIMKATATISAIEGTPAADYTMLSDALRLLPRAHYHLLRYLGEHFHRVAEHSVANSTTVQNLAVVMAPILMSSPNKSATIFKNLHLQQYFLECVITRQKELFF